MANSDINKERFAHDVCVHVLKKYGIFKATDDTRKQNKYMSDDFLPCVARAVMFCAFRARDGFKKALEEKYETAEHNDEGKLRNFLDYHRLRDDKFEERICTEKVCDSLALCTECIQFASTKDITISLNKIVIRWGEYFDQHLKEEFEEKGGFLKMYSDLKIFQMDRLDNSLDEFISGYCLPYGVGECSTELLKVCRTKMGISMDDTIFGVKTKFILHYFIYEMSKRSKCNLSTREGPQQESDTSDSESSSVTTDSSENDDSEMSRRIGSEASDSEASQNNLLGIPPHEEMLREIDPFFVENIPLPPKPRSASRSPEGQPSSSATPSTLESVEDGAGSRNAPPTTSKLSDDGAGSRNAPPTASKLSEDGTGSSDAPPTASKLSEDGVGSRDAPPTASKLSEDGVGSSHAPPTASRLSDDGTGSSHAPPTAFKLSVDGTGSSNATPTDSKLSEDGTGFRVASPTASKSREREHDPSDALRVSPEEDFEEQVEQILSRMEQDMEALRALLHRHRLLTTKLGRRGARIRTKDSKDTFPPKAPEGLIETSFKETSNERDR